MKVRIKSKGSDAPWVYMSYISEISITLENGAQVDLFDTDEKTLLAAVSKCAATVQVDSII